MPAGGMPEAVVFVCIEGISNGEQEGPCDHIGIGLVAGTGVGVILVEKIGEIGLDLYVAAME